MKFEKAEESVEKSVKNWPQMRPWQTNFCEYQLLEARVCWQGGRPHKAFTKMRFPDWRRRMLTCVHNICFYNMPVMFPLQFVFKYWGQIKHFEAPRASNTKKRTWTTRSGGSVSAIGCRGLDTRTKTTFERWTYVLFSDLAASAHTCSQAAHPLCAS